MAVASDLWSRINKSQITSSQEISNAASLECCAWYRRHTICSDLGLTKCKAYKASCGPFGCDSAESQVFCLSLIFQCQFEVTACREQTLEAVHILLPVLGTSLITTQSE
jgi:hypothetical protein